MQNKPTDNETKEPGVCALLHLPDGYFSIKTRMWRIIYYHCCYSIVLYLNTSFFEVNYPFNKFGSLHSETFWKQKQLLPVVCTRRTVAPAADTRHRREC